MELAPHIFMAPFGSRSIVLDLKRDRYLAMGVNLTAAALHFAGYRASHRDWTTRDLDAAKAQLHARGIIIEPTQSPIDDRFSKIPQSDLWPDFEKIIPHSRAFSAQISALSCLTAAQTALSTQPFHRTIAWARLEKQSSRLRRMRWTPQALLDAFAAARPWFPINPICRLDALALCLHFWRNGQDASLVFGVRLEPFYAHCWAQRIDAVLNEPADGVGQYNPILEI